MVVLPVIPEISPALCTGCRECLVVCRPQALALVNGIAVVAHPELCEYDGGCEPACPAGAIALPYLVVFKEISDRVQVEGKMQATKILMEEHRVIERVLTSLDTAANRLDRGEAVRPGFFLDAADFVKGFADGCHHKKEEGVLFEAMVDSGLPRQAGPIAVMLAEHEQGRAYTRNMRGAAQKLEAGDQAARAQVVENARGYVTLLRQHIGKEDQVLFPMADHVIPLSKQDQVAEDFERVEHEETGEGVHEKYLALAGALEREVA
jgi:hemerythrin-like domain-containing protein/NAD-dependent dihydropyrimidine dehydrogenase PreA subunit